MTRTDRDTKALIRRMAAAMFRIRGETGECTRDDLLQQGFDGADIDRYGATAKVEAARLHGVA